jgi:hypothetical protein
LSQYESLLYGVFLGAIVSIILGHIFNKVKDKIDRLTALVFKKLYHTITVSLPGKTTYFATVLRNYFRGRKLNKHKVFRKTLYNESAVTREIIKTYSYFLLFWLSISFYFLLIVLGSLNDIFDKNLVLGIFTVSPVYLFQIMWMLASSKSNKLIKCRGRIRITSKSTRT